MTRKRYSELSRPARTQRIATSSLGAAASLTLLLVLYYAASLDRGLDTGTLIIFGLGLLGFAGVITWQIRKITRSDLPGCARSRPSRPASRCCWCSTPQRTS